MHEWHFELKRRPQENAEALQAALGLRGGFKFTMKPASPQFVSFKIRKRILYMWYLAYQNWTVVSGNFWAQNGKQETRVKIRFQQHWLIKVIIIGHLLLSLAWLLALLLDSQGHGTRFLIATLALALAGVLLLALRKKFRRDVRQYKSLIAKILVEQ